MRTDFDRLNAELDSQLERLHVAQAQLAAERVVAASPDGSVSATVDGGGALIGLEIVDGALRRAHPAGIGPQIVAAVAEARAEADQRARGVIADLAPGLLLDQG